MSVQTNPYQPPAKESAASQPNKWPQPCPKCGHLISFRKFFWRNPFRWRCVRCGVRLKIAPKWLIRVEIGFLLLMVIWGGLFVTAFEVYQDSTIDPLLEYFFKRFNYSWKATVTLTISLIGVGTIVPLLFAGWLMRRLERRHALIVIHPREKAVSESSINDAATDEQR